jgi:hypothetical protein
MIGAPVTIFLSAGAVLLVRGVAAWQTGYWGADARLSMHRFVFGNRAARIGWAGTCARPPPRAADGCGHPTTAPPERFHSWCGAPAPTFVVRPGDLTLPGNTPFVKPL